MSGHAENRPIRALGLLSGGLDSMLAARLLLDQGVGVTALVFRTPFFGSARGERAAGALGIPCRVVDITEPHLAMVKNPPHGYGRNMNPCIDCHAMMFRVAGGMMDETGASFLFSGEVLGQRPMSQNYASLRTVERASGHPGLVLRPLSARLLPETEPEKRGQVDRARLLDIQGRSRKRQLELAEGYGIREFPNPAGGCLLTDPVFSVRLRELLDREPSAGPREVERLKVGRHFRLPGGSKAVVGRNRQDNEALEGMAGAGDILLRVDGVPGPITLLDASSGEDDVRAAAALTVRYSKASGPGPFAVAVEQKGAEGGTAASVVQASPMDEGTARSFRVE